MWLDGLAPLYEGSMEMSALAIPSPHIAYRGSAGIPTTRMPLALLRLCRGFPAIAPGSALDIVLQHFPHGHQWAERGDTYTAGTRWEEWREWAAWPKAHCDALAVPTSIWGWTCHCPWRSSRGAESRLLDVPDISSSEVCVIS